MRTSPAPSGTSDVKHQVGSTNVMPGLLEGPHHTCHVRLPACHSRLQVGGPKGFGRVIVERGDAPGAVITWSGGDQYPLRKSEWHDVAIVVVGVLTDQVDPTRGSPDPCWLPVSSSSEGPGRAAASLLTRRTVSGGSHLIRWSRGLRPIR